MMNEHADTAPEGEAHPLSDNKMAEENDAADGRRHAEPSAEDTDGSALAVEPDTAGLLRDEWGADFDANLALARDATRAVADDELVELLEENGLGDDPRVIRAAVRIGRLLQDSRERGRPSASVDEGESLEATLDELSRRPDYWSEQVQCRIRQIHLALHGDGPIAVHRVAGDGGRG